MLPANVIFLAAFISLCATGSYAVSTLRGKTQPNRVTWFMWALAPLIAAAAQWSGGVGRSTAVVFTAGFGPLAVFLCSFANPKAYWKSTFFDYICGVLALIGLIGWLMTRNPDIAIAFSILSDLFAAIPTLHKAYHNPQSEYGPAFLLGMVSSTIGVLCVQQWTFTAYGFVTYLAVLNVALSVVVYRKRL